MAFLYLLLFIFIHMDQNLKLEEIMINTNEERMKGEKQHERMGMKIKKRNNMDNNNDSGKDTRD